MVLRVDSGGCGGTSDFEGDSREALRVSTPRITNASAAAAAMPSSRFSMISSSAKGRSARPAHDPPFRLRHDDSSSRLDRYAFC